MADVTITIDGETTRLVTSVKKADAAIKMMGGSAETAGRKLQDAGDKSARSLEKTVVNISRVVAGARAMTNAFQAANAKVTELQGKMAQIGAERGGAALRASQAAVTGGMDQRMVGAFMSQTGAMSQDDKAALIESMAKSGEEFTPQRFIELTTAGNSGVFSNAQLQEAITSGESLDVAGQRGKLLPAALREIETRTKLNELAAQSTGVDTFRIAGGMQDATDMRDPGKASLRAIIPSLSGPIEQAKALTLARENAENTRRAAAALERRKLNVGWVKDE